jgi:hypothetical protein
MKRDLLTLAVYALTAMALALLWAGARQDTRIAALEDALEAHQCEPIVQEVCTFDHVVTSFGVVPLAPDDRVEREHWVRADGRPSK